MTLPELETWLREENPSRLEELWAWADRVRRENVGDEVHLRGLLEISNYCVRSCGYCGIRAGNRKIKRYRMTAEEILACARQAVDYGYGTLVMQAGEDYGLTREWVAGIVRRVKTETTLAVTLSLGERPEEDLAAWRQAEADRYLLRFETSDRELYDRIHPPRPGQERSERFALLRQLRELGYEVGSGVMIGIPGQTYGSLARDIEAFAELDLDMIGVGPWLPHPETPLGRCASPPGPLSLGALRAGSVEGEQSTGETPAPPEEWGTSPVGGEEASPRRTCGAQPLSWQERGKDGGSGEAAAVGRPLPWPPHTETGVTGVTPLPEQVPNTELMTYKVVALARLVCPEANIPSTTALATLNKATGRELGLARGANVVMPNLTPVQYRALYEIYPEKACVNETAEACRLCLAGRIHALGRRVGQGPGGRRRRRPAARAAEAGDNLEEVGVS